MSKAKDAKIRKTDDKLIAGHYQVILSPVITEKSTTVSEHNQVMFKVRAEASKPLIRRAIEKLFDVKVEAVNTHNRKGKTKRFRGRPGQRSDVKYAIVTLAEGDKIDVSTGVS
ncbi:MAG: 50S ribosomal protein L23 [Alphaproteobacteria bacterium]|nr:50S ribosomal protein L23 [Alphaproteobacteria bacterium]